MPEKNNSMQESIWNINCFSKFTRSSAFSEIGCSCLKGTWTSDILKGPTPCKERNYIHPVNAILILKNWGSTIANLQEQFIWRISAAIVPGAQIPTGQFQWSYRSDKMLLIICVFKFSRTWRTIFGLPSRLQKVKMNPGKATNQSAGIWHVWEEQHSWCELLSVHFLISCAPDTFVGQSYKSHSFCGSEKHSHVAMGTKHIWIIRTSISCLHEMLGFRNWRKPLCH